MKVLVTGGAGFVGSHVCERLLALGHQVAIIDELNDFYSPAAKRANLDQIRSRGECAFHLTDICDESRMSGIFDREAPDAVIHLAARAGVRPSLVEPYLYERVNTHGTLVILEEMRKRKIPKLIFASSSSVYGATNKAPFREDEVLNQPISPYAATKLAAEHHCHVYAHLYGLSVVCLRLFTVYGPRQRPDLAIHKFVHKIDRGEPIPVYGDGSSGRDYTYVEDIANGIISALSAEFSFEIANLGNSHPIRLEEMIRIIEQCVGKNAVIDRQPQQPGDAPLTYADISRARQLLNYSPETSFEEGIGKFVEWYREGHSVLSRAGDD